ncbi:MAG TPA: TAT-variant-translocated molybdopterin oxidoreductase [Phycisphaerales bacterium]|nr:TAT-variant-translocated molybdopterin oxidoreductase [Phycisphaerales bacterium]
MKTRSEFGELNLEQASCGSSCGCASASTGDAAAASEDRPVGAKYWRSLEEYADTPEFREFMHREFPAGASELLDSGDRRHFLRIMGASMALAGVGLAGGCRRWPEETIVPYARRPEGRMPGVPVQYATSMELGGVAQGLLATSYDGRPIKIEGNPLHPMNRGGTDAIAQASVLDLYDPDRSRSPRHNGAAATRAEFLAWLQSRMAGVTGRGLGLSVLCEATNSPTVVRLRRELKARYPELRWHEYEPLNNDNEHNGSVLAFGAPYRTLYSFDRTAGGVIVSLDSDFLMTHPAMVQHTREFAQGRRAMDANRTMNRLYVCEGAHTVTGANADVRYAMRSADIGIVAGRILHHILGTAPFQGFYEASLPTPPGASNDWIEKIVADLQANRGRSIVIAGPRQPAEVHMLVHLINNILGNDAMDDSPIRYLPMPEQVPHVESLRGLARDIDSGQVQTLFIIGGNPAYNAPADLNFAQSLQTLRNRGGAAVHLSGYVDETSELCEWHVNRAHYLEAWGDGRAWDGTVCLAQPLIEPLFDGLSAIELLAEIAGRSATGHELVQRTFADLGGRAGEVEWRQALHDGVKEVEQPEFDRPRFRRDAIPAVALTVRERYTPAKADEMELVFIQDTAIYDGRFANNGWLQELPDVMSKVTWDNALLINPATGKRLGMKTGDMATVTAGGRSMDVPVLLLPGQHEGSASLALGYGRRVDWRIATGAGFDSYQLRTTESMGFAPARVSKSRGSYILALTQDHYAIDPGIAGVGGRGAQRRLPTLFREATREKYIADPKFAKHPEGLHVPHRLSLWEEKLPFHREGKVGAEAGNTQYAWAMSIDLTACTGCQACVVACQAENNIPVVGKDQVRRSREMHWLRVDRYFRTDDMNRPDAEARPDAVSFAPIPCMHCENAPCEQVCPVAATVHDKDGLNVMVYNRCIGTRYCSNNCPYKVRRFNYFDYFRRKPFREREWLHVDAEYYTTPQAHADPMLQMQFNPEVTIRSRGVMEKCTFCIQRITRGRIKAKNDWMKLTDEQKRTSDRVPVKDGEILPACAQACPAQAIVFGDLLDPDSRVSKMHAHERTYEMLEELNTKPRTRYMGKLRNPPSA